jgi:ribosomal protein S18 acetylase RimI-like enzyme
MKASALGATDRPAALAHLAGRARENLWLLDLVSSLGELPPPGEAGAEVVGAFDRHRLCGLLALRPCVVAETGLSDAALRSFQPWLATLHAGLMKSPLREADVLWSALAAEGRRPLVDRGETSWMLIETEARLAPAEPASRVRHARVGDLAALVHAARASLAEEGRPDPFELDPEGFRRWVRGRVARAWVVEAGSRIVFAGYADVQRPEGWLLQGVYTWPEARRRGHARAGVAALCRAAFHAGAQHVQLAVVMGNEAAEGLYRGLGFRPFAGLRTVLFEAPHG